MGAVPVNRQSERLRLHPSIPEGCVNMLPPALPCPHTPANPRRRDVPKYVFFEACWAGCLGCVQQFLDDDPSLINDSSDNCSYTGVAWAEWGVEMGRVECKPVVAYLKVKKQELANEEESAAQAAAGSRSVELDQAMDGLTCAEGSPFKKRRVNMPRAALPCPHTR